MRQAGRYLPEYRELRKKHSFEQLCATPELAAEVTLQPLRRFPLDAAIIFADLVTPLAAIGRPFRFEPGPVLDNPVRTGDEIRALPEPPGEEIGPEVYEALRIVKRELGGKAALLGFGGAPWSLAAYLCEGKHVNGFPTIRALAAGRPDLLGELLGKLSRLSARYLIQQHRSGADAVQVFDTWAGLLAVEDWKRLVRPHLSALLEELGKAGVPRILFLQDAPHLVEHYATLPSEGLALDWRIDLAGLRERLGTGKALQGNLDPAVLLAGPQVTRAAMRELLRRVPRRGHIANLGHGILPETPIASVEALVACVQDDAQNHEEARA
jgi:uroporphyrinogen decarboxylase